MLIKNGELLEIVEVSKEDIIDGKFIIPEGVTRIGEYAFEGCSSLTDITIPEGVTSIGDYAFKDCRNLTRITIPEGVIYIEDWAFEGCSSLTDITIPEGVTYIGDSAFRNCRNLTQVTIPQGVTEIEDGSFSGCSSLTDITIPLGVTSVGGFAFKNCSSLNKITIPEGVTKIAYSAFEGCSSLTQITIPEGVTSIGKFAFRDCSSLTDITIPEGITYIEGFAFKNCSSLNKIAIPEGVTKIEYSAFEDCSSLTDITIPEGVTKIEDNAFKNCSSLNKIAIPEGVTKIAYSAFEGCRSLTDIIIPKGVTKIGEYAFSGCSSLTDITIPEGVTSIGEYAFSGCSSLNKIAIPEGVTSIGEYAFSGCSGLTDITIPEGVTSIKYSAFEGCRSLTDITIPEGVTSIKYSAFKGCSSLKNITIPKGVTEIGAFSFKGCSSLKNITLPEGITSIRDNVFDGCSSLTDITIPKGVASIGNTAFRDCRNLTQVTILEGITEIGDGAFKNCSSLTDIIIPEGVTDIGAFSFSDCSSLKNITLPEGVTYIGDSAFKNCSSLTQITIPEGVTKIGYDVFKNCSNLEKIEILSDDIAIPLNAFTGCTNLKEPSLPENKKYGQVIFKEGGYITIYEDEHGKTQVESHTYSMEELIKREKVDSSISKEEQEKIYNEYQKEFEIISRIYRDMPFKYSRNFNIEIGIEYIEKIRKVLGNEEVEAMFRLPQEIDLENTNSNILSVYEKRYSMKGSMPITVDILNNISGVVGKTDRIKLFKEINGMIEKSDGNITFEEMMKECSKRAGIEINEEVIWKIKGRVLRKEYTRKEEEIEEAIEKEVRESNIEHRGIVSGIIANVIRKNEIEEGKEEKIEEILQEELRKKKEDGSEYYGRGITNEQMQERIRGIIKEIYENNKDLVGKTVIEKIKETKEKVGERWIGKILQVTNKIDLDNITSEEYEEMLKGFKEQGIETRDIEEEIGKGKLVLKAGVSKEEAYNVLVEEEHPQVLTYEKAEMMFSAMKDPYSEKFATWFKDNREEIMERPEIYTILAEVHNRFEDKILRDITTMTRFEQGLLDVNTVIDIYEETLDKLEAKEGNEELAYKAQLVGMSQERFDETQEIFEVTKKRERSYIPTVESESKNYRGRILRADDVMNILAGDATDCCQRVEDVGENSARHGAMENTGRIFVVEELDECGNPIKIVAQSWVWRNKDRMCFDNIEVPTAEQGKLKNGVSSEDISRQEEILEIYKECAKRAISKDEKLFNRLLKEGKITEEQYEALVLKDVTVGIGYNDLGILEKRGLEKVEEEYMMSPKMSKDISYNEEQHGGSPWIDSGVDDGWQMYLAKNEKNQRKKIGTHEIEEVALEEMYKNKREVMKLKGGEISKAIGIIKEIEGVVFREGQQMLGEVRTYTDIAEIYGMDNETIEVYVSREKDWYMIYEEREEEIYIADLGAINGVNSQGKGKRKTETLSQSVEMIENIYGLMLQAEEKGKSIRLNATDDTSYLNIQNMADKGIIQIQESESREWDDTGKIGMHDMVITVDAEKMKEELDRISRYRQRLEDRDDKY